MIDDLAVRLRALDPATSFIVQAPAGSGKTELLIQRYLKLLARVESPESVVAITFTKKAAGEMRARVLEALRTAARGVVPAAPHERETFELAAEALARDAASEWHLLDNPARLRIQTIDALSASITRQMPWLARFGAPPDITEKASDLYHEAARNTLRMVEVEERRGVHGSLSLLLLHLDNNFRQAETLLASMLEKRDQWLRHTGVNPDLARVRAELEHSLSALIEKELIGLRDSIPYDAVPDILCMLEFDELPMATAEHLADWLRLADLVLTKDGKLRKKAPPDQSRERCARLFDVLGRNEAVLARLKELRRLPPATFSDTQWRTMEALVDTLPKAVAQLQLVFRERGRVDFAELSIRASDALGRLESPADLALSLGYRIRHLLVDEFQDTSYTQFDLLRKLTAAWEPEDGHSLFLVGDPMQSIYRFREADVSLFLKARREGIGEVRLEPLALTTNFRSDPAIVDWVNQIFSHVLPAHEDIGRGAVSYSPSIAHRAASEVGTSPQVHAFLNEGQAAEAKKIVGLAAQATGTVAILVRARSHLVAVITELRTRSIPFQAIEIDQLGDRPIIQDLMALTFALIHLADRISWLAILRAPWCGLSIEDLQALVARGHASTIWELLNSKDKLLTRDGSMRLERCLPSIAEALNERGRVSLRNLVEQTWLRLGGPACVAVDSDLADADAYFDLLEGLQEAGDLSNFQTLREQVSELFAQPDTLADERLQIMTIHKAKGLEFDTVILPGLGQPPRGEENKLLVWQEQEGELLLAPVNATGEENDPIYRYLTHLEHEKVRQEDARLLYVACTRAKNHLHLLGCAFVNENDGELTAPKKGSFLKLLWPAVGPLFAERARESKEKHLALATDEQPTRLIQRLPAAWTLPPPPPPVVWRRESPGLIEAPAVSFEWVGDTLRHVGTVLHAFMRRIAKEGVEQWDAAKIGHCRPAIQSMLGGLGVPPLEVAQATDRVTKALGQTLRDDQGRWVLADHAEAESEYSITGLLEGKVYRADLDRTFVDEMGVRWIIDYKTSSHEGGGLENFLEEEKRRYGPQLGRYARLMAQRDDRPIRLALYFPLLTAWQEWAAPTVKRKQASLFE